MRNKGFTLVEVLVASVVLAITVTACATLLIHSSRTAAMAQEDTIASMIASSCFARLSRVNFVSSEALVKQAQEFLTEECRQSDKIESAVLTVEIIGSAPGQSYRITINLKVRSGRTLAYTSTISEL